MNKFESVAKTVGKDVAHGVVTVVKDIPKIVTVGEKLIKVIEDGKAMTPEFKTELATLTNDAKSIALVVSPAVLTGGTNVTVDLAAIEPAIQDIIKLVKDFLSFLPQLEAAVTEIKADLAA